MGRAYLTAVPEKERNDIMEQVRELADAGRWPELQQRRGQGAARRFENWGSAVLSAIGEGRQCDCIAGAAGGGLPPMAINCGAPAHGVQRVPVGKGTAAVDRARQ